MGQHILDAGNHHQHVSCKLAAFLPVAITLIFQPSGCRNILTKSPVQRHQTPYAV